MRQKEYDKVYRKLNNLYDLELEGSANEGMFHTKEQELSQELARLKSELACCEEVNSPEVCQKASQTLEIINNHELRD